MENASSDVHAPGAIQGRMIENFHGFQGTHAVDRARHLAEIGLLDEAKVVIDAALEIQPSMDNARFNRGLILMQLGRYEEAISDLDHVIKYQNQHGKSSDHSQKALYAKGFCNLTLGRLRTGFTDMEAGKYPLRKDGPGTCWNGVSDISGKTLLVVCESLNESILLSRYLSCPPSSTDVVLSIPPELVLLFNFLPKVRIALRTLGHYDYFCSLMALAAIYSDNHPPPSQGFNLPLDQIVRWRAGLARTGSALFRPFRVGLCWSGPIGSNDISLELLSSLLNLKIGAEFYSMQASVHDEDKRAFDTLDIWAMGQKFESVVDMACAMKSMDLVVSIDCVAAHLASTLNVPTWVLLPKRKMDWLWTNKDVTNSFYPRTRTFRQSKDGDWSNVVTEVGKELVKFCRLQPGP